MPKYLMLLAPAANRVYAAGAEQLAAAELEICTGVQSVEPTEVAGVGYLGFTADSPPAGLAGQSAFLGLFERCEDLLRPVEVALPSGPLGGDLVSIPKYPGKTNEQFTRLLLNLTLSQIERAEEITKPLTILDPMCGRGTTLTTAWLMGHHGAGVESDVRAIEALNAFLRTYLRRARVKHRIELNPVRRDGKALGKKLQVELGRAGQADNNDQLSMTIFTGDTRDSKRLWGKKQFDAVVVDAPYGVVHGSESPTASAERKRDRSPAALLTEAVPVWVSQLRRGGALGLSWNTHGLTREALVALLTDSGLRVHEGEPWLRLAHRVDSSITRDVVVATKA